jgi:hypothetical protein
MNIRNLYCCSFLVYNLLSCITSSLPETIMLKLLLVLFNAAVGFTPLGIAAGSVAAAIQAGIGDVIAGSAFAILQSVGAQGGFAALTGGGVATALIAACSNATEIVE